MGIDNEVLRCIRGRRSTRRFTGEQVAPAQLDALLEAAVWAPSGGNNQSWLFTAIQDRETITRLNELVREAFRHWTPDDDYPGKHAARTQSGREGYHFCHGAPTLIIASNRPNYENAMADCALALGNIFLAAHSLGLGSCYINQLHWLRDDPAVRTFLAGLGIPREHTICSAAAVGHAAEAAAAPARKEGTIHIIRQS